LSDLVGDEWWVDVTLPMLETARRRIRGLVRLLEKRKRVVVYTDFIDDLGKVEEVALHRGGAAGTDFERFRQKARAYLRAHADHVALQKLRRNFPLTQTDLDELDRMLAEAGLGEPLDLARARTEGDGLGAFIRSLVGLDRDAATDALSGFVNGRTLTADQHDFVALVVEHLTANGAMDVGLLYEPPFTSVAAGGPESLFPDADVDALIAAIRAVGANAHPRDEVA
jgi:type I restriction enzyme R subunit